MADEGSGVPSVCLISGIQSLGSMPGQPAASLSTNRSPVQSCTILPLRRPPPPSPSPSPATVTAARRRCRRRPLSLPGGETGGCRHAAAQRHFRTAPKPSLFLRARDTFYPLAQAQA